MATLVNTERRALRNCVMKHRDHDTGSSPQGATTQGATTQGQKRALRVSTHGMYRALYQTSAMQQIDEIRHGAV